MSFFSGLKRRNVIRVATAYVVGSWLIILLGVAAATTRAAVSTTSAGSSRSGDPGAQLEKPPCHAP